MKEKFLSILLTLCMALSLLPATVWAEDAGGASSGHSHYLCGESVCTEGHDMPTFNKKLEMKNSVLCADGTEVSTYYSDYYRSTYYELGAGNYYLEDDVVLNLGIYISDNVNLCLNGNTITANGNFDAITVVSGGTFTLTDCMGSGSEYGKITHTDGKTGSGVLMYRGGTFNMYGGSITGNNAGNNANGGGVNMNDGGIIFNMYGGSITDNTAGYNGGGVYISGGAFNMYDGSITGNTATGSYGGGGVYVNGTFNMNGGNISSNTTTSPYGGGGVYVGGTMTVSGNVNITDNKKSGTTNNVYLPNGGNTITITISGALTGGAGSIGVTTGDTPEKQDVKIAKGADKYKVTDTDRQAFVSDVDNNKYKVTYNKVDKAFYLTKSSNTITQVPEHDDHPICGASCTCTDGSSHGNITDWTKLDKTTPLPESPGHYYLTEDLTLGNTWEPANGVVLCLNGHSITGADGRAVITVGSGKEFTLTDCKPKGKEGEITHVQDKTGSGVSVVGTFDMYDGSITGNTTEDNGGGVYIYSSTSGAKGTFNMYGGKITENTTEGNGGGVYVYDGTFNMKNGSITNNVATGTNSYGGGGVYVDSSGTFTMNNGSITNNAATGTDSYGGGGVYVSSNQNGVGSFTMNGGSITNNNANAGSKGGGVYVESTMTVSGNAQIKDNVTGNTANNVYLDRSKTITIGTGGLEEDASIGVTTQDAPSGEYTVTFATGGSSYIVTDTDKAAFFPDDSQYEVKKNTDDNTLYLAVKSDGDNPSSGEHTNHPICGATCSHTGNDKHTDVTWKGISTEEELRAAEANNNYYLENDITLTHTSWTPANNVVLCLNGNSIKGADDAYVITVDSGVTFKLTDCKPEGKEGTITHGTKPVSTQDADTPAEKYTGSGVKVSGRFDMYNGKITGNEAPDNYYGGGVFVYGGTFNMYGGNITDNTAGNNASGGGVYVHNSGTFTMNGGSITDNTAKYGGGVYVYSNTFTMNGGSINGNNATNGGGVYVGGTNSTFTMNGGSIIGNTAGTGAGVFVEGTFNMSRGSSIIGNTATGYGGGVYVLSGTMTVSGNVNITGNKKGNTTNGTDNNVYLWSNTIAIGTDGLNSNAKIGVTLADNYGNKAFTSGWNTHMNTAPPADYFTSDKSGYTVKKDNAGELKLVANSATDTNITISGVPNTIAYGDTFKLTANNAENADSTGTWTWLSDNEVLAVTGNGNSATVKAMKSGTAQITVSYGSATATTEMLTVNKRQLTAKYDDKEITVGDAFPEITITYGNFASGDNKDDVIESAPGYYLKHGNGMIGEDAARNNAGTYTIIRGNGSFVLKDGMQDKYECPRVQSGTLTVQASSGGDSGSGGSSSGGSSSGGSSSGGSSSGGSSSGGGGGSSKYAVTASSADNGNVTLDKTSAKKGSTVTITPQANDGFALDKITVTDKNGSEIKLTDNGNGTFTFTMPASKVTINTTFKEIEKTPETEPPKEEVKQTVVKMQINSKRLIVNDTAYEKDAAPVIRNDRTLVPIRFITESLGGKVTWNEKAKEVVLTIDGKEIKMTIGKTLEKYGVAPIIMDDRTFVPIRFVADELGATVAWDEPTKTVTVTKTVTEQK